MYLVDGVDVDVKRFLTFYLLCDLVATAQQGEQGKVGTQMKSHVLTFDNTVINKLKIII